MKYYATHHEYAEEPSGGYIIQQSCLVWRNSPRLGGVVFWGRLELSQVARLTRALVNTSEGWRQLLLLDVRRVESIDLATFSLLRDILSVCSDRPGRRVAVLRPGAFGGVGLAALLEIHAPQCSVAVFTDPPDALAWLGAVDESEVIRELDDVLVSLTGVTPILYTLRAHLERNLGQSNLATASAALGMSARALQRKLHDANTSFQLEQNTAQIRFARHLLLHTNEDIKRIAFEVGCSSPAAFCALFRRIEGQAPSAWRSQFAPMHRGIVASSRTALGRALSVAQG